MTDNEIIKALECCETSSCSICPCFKNNLGIIFCQSALTHSALDLINRQQAEIEKLKEALHECHKHDVLGCTK